MVKKITKWHVLIPFLGNYQRHVILADMEREIGVSHQVLKKYADMLVKKGILLEERKPKNIIYSINRENTMVLNYLSSAEGIVLEERLDQNMILKRFYEMLGEYIATIGILVFGSSAGGKIGEDIDVLAVGKRSIKTITLKFEKTYGKRIHLIETGNMPAEKSFIKEIIKKHIIFSRFDMFIKHFWDFTWKN